MFRAAAILASVALVCASPAYAQFSSPISPGISAASLSAVQAQIPVAASSIPPSEAIGGAVGATVTYARADHTHPRITRVTNCTLDSTGSCSGVWSTAMSANPAIVATPINSNSAQAIVCNSTSAPTTTTFAVKCWMTQSTVLSLSLVTAGLTLIPAAPAPAGTVVQILAIPPAQ